MKRFAYFSRYTVLPLALALLIIGPSLWPADAQQNPYRSSNNNYGVSGGNVRDITRRFCCSGTLGSLVQDNTGVQYILSNNHVVGLSGKATFGDDISQPGLIDNNCGVAEVVADFTAAPGLNTGVDAAIAQLRTGAMNSTGAIEGIGTISSVVRAPALNLGVKKSGRTTGTTTGTVTGINATVSVRYPKSCGSGGGSTFTFTNQVVIGQSGFSAGGDSGSLIVTNNSCAQPVALLFAGSSSSTIGNPVGQVLTQVGNALSARVGSTRTVSFVGGTCTSTASLEAFDQLPSLSREMVNRASAAKERNEVRIMSRRSVIGMGVGVSDEDPSEAVIVVYVNQNGPRPRLPRQIDGLRVKVIETDEFVAY
jgi:hypothetical protein